MSRNVLALSVLLSMGCDGSMGSNMQTLPPESVLPPNYDAGAPPPVADAGTPVADASSPPTPVPDATTPPTPPPGSSCGGTVPANDQEWSVSHGGRNRSFFVHLPPGYNGSGAVPVVIDFHGRTVSPQAQMVTSGMRSVADAHGFIAVHPAGIGATWNAGLCCGEAMSSNVDDVGFVRAMLDELEARLCVDTTRVYATGLSNGGYMSHRLACELSDRIAAIGPVAGPNAMLSCSPTRAVPVFHFHGTGDRIVPYEGFLGRLGVRDTMDQWAARNGCNSGPSVFLMQGDVRCEEWTGCRDNATVKLCTVDGGGHQWPGGTSIPLLGPNTTAISASEMMWTFFTEHTLSP